jgi:predicted nucleic acid-binding protein
VILYLDTSSLVKLYVEEDGSAAVRAEVTAAAVVATSEVAYAEARAALARLRRERALSAAELRRARAALDDDWPQFLAVHVTGAICQAAGDLAEKHALRGYDSLHLASYLALRAGHAGPVRFSSFDRRLSRAAAHVSRAQRRR